MNSLKGTQAGYVRRKAVELSRELADYKGKGGREGALHETALEFLPVSKLYDYLSDIEYTKLEINAEIVESPEDY